MMTATLDKDGNCFDSDKRLSSMMGWLGEAVIATISDLNTFDPGRNGFAESSR